MGASRRKEYSVFAAKSSGETSGKILGSSSEMRENGSIQGEGIFCVFVAWAIAKLLLLNNCNRVCTETRRRNEQ